MGLMEMRREMLLVSFGGKNMKLIYTGTIANDYTATLLSLYTNEIKPHITFGDFSKLCICIFENNQYTGSNPINCVFFSLSTDITSFTTQTRNGGMVRGNYANIRNLELSNDARCSAGTVLKIYTVDI